MMLNRYQRPIRSIHVELSTFCNLACPQCPRTFGDEPNPNLVLQQLYLEDIERLIPPEDICQLKQILLCGNYGEPAMAKDALEIVQYIRSVSPTIKIEFKTNGSLRTPQWWMALSEAIGNYGWVDFAVDGLEDTNHLYRRGAKWVTLIENIKAYASTKKSHFRIETLLFGHNVHQKEAIRELGAELGVMNPETCARFKLEPIVFKKTTRFVHPSVSWLKLLPQESVELEKGAVSCMAANQQSMYLGADGIFYPCCYIGMRPYSPFDNEDALRAREESIEDLNLLPLNPTHKSCHITCTQTKTVKKLPEEQFHSKF